MTGWDTEMLLSGYTSCKCAECFEISISNDAGEAQYCNQCESWGCDESGCQVEIDTENEGE